MNTTRESGRRRSGGIMLILGLLGGALVAQAQTQVNLSRQSKDVDFSLAPVTLPVRTGATLPSNCTVGQMFFNTAAPAGGNLYGCTAANVWSPLGAGGGAGAASQLADFKYGQISSGVASIGANCSTGTPCVYRFGGVFTAVTSMATMTLSGTPANDTAFVYLSINNTPALTVGYGGAETIACSGCTVAAAVTGFPTDGSAIPLFSVGINNNTWASAATEARAVYSKEFIQPAQGIVISPDAVTGAVTVQVDSTVVPRYFTGAGAPTINCISGRDLYVDTNTLNPYICGSTNTWKQIAIPGVSTVPFSSSPNFNLALGDQYITLTGNVVSPTATNITPGQRVTFTICQDGTGSRSFAWPANFHGAMTVGATPSTCSSQQFESPNGTQLYATAAGVINQ